MFNFLRYPNGMLFLCVVMGVGETQFFQKITIISKSVWRWERNNTFFIHIIENKQGGKYFNQVLNIWLWVWFKTF
jgi:hypothetical protein